jgi:hypothetical protein
MTTDFDNKAQILAQVWMECRNDQEFEDFIEYNDLGLPMAYALSEDLITVSERGTAFIDETFALLLTTLGIKEDTGFESLEDIFAESGNLE